MEDRTDPPRCRVIVVSRNTRSLLARCLDSLEGRTAGVPYEVVVVDNGSLDGSVCLVRERHPRVKLICAEENRGYSAAINLGSEGASAEYLLIMNADVELEPDSLARMVSFMDRTPDAAVAGPMLLNPDGSIQRSFNRSFPGLLSLLSYATGVASLRERLYRTAWVRRILGPLLWRCRNPRRVSWVGGACFIVRRNVFEELSGMDEEYFLYSEDADLCRRARGRGMDVWYVPGAGAIHWWNSSIGKLPDSGFLSSLRSTRVYYGKYHRRMGGVVKGLLLTGIMVRLCVAALTCAIPRRRERGAQRMWLCREALEMLTGCPVRERLKAKVLGAYLPMRKKLLRVSFPFHRATDGSRGLPGIRKILVLREDGMGDMVLTLPFLRMLKKTYPRSLLYVLASRRNQDLLSADPDVYQVIVSTWNGIRGGVSLLRRLRAERFDLVIDPFITHSLRSALLARGAGGFSRAGFDVWGRGMLFNVRPPGADLDASMLLTMRRLAESLGYRGPAKEQTLEGRLTVTPKDAAWARDTCARHGISSSEVLLGIHPGGRYPSQRWPIERFYRVALEVRKRAAVKVVLFHRSGWEDLPDIAGELPEGIVMLEAAGTGRFGALVSVVSLLLCNNSGPLHVARALGIPTLSLTGPTRPAYVPYGESIHRVCESDVPCRPCDKPFCFHHRCLQSIDEREVAELALEMLCRSRASICEPAGAGPDRSNER